MKPDIIIASVGIALFVFAIFAISNLDINYGISLADADIPVGTEAVLIYEIGNGYLSGTVHSVKLYYYIEGQTDELFIILENLQSGSTVKDIVNIPTSGVTSGEHTVITRLEYWKGSQWYAKYLTLKLVVY